VTIEIKLLGSGCENCTRLYGEAEIVIDAETPVTENVAEHEIRS